MKQASVLNDSSNFDRRSLRKTSLLAGFFYLLTFVSVPTFALYDSIHKTSYATEAVNETNVMMGGLLEIIVGLAGICTAVVLYPVVKGQSKVAALGLVASRILEAGTIFVGVAFLLSAVTLPSNLPIVEKGAIRQTLVVLYDRIFLLGQSFLPAINDLLLGYMLYKSKLVPRFLSVIGMAGAFPLIAGYLAIFFGIIDRSSVWAGLSALMVAFFEFSLGIYLLVKGFRQVREVKHSGKS